MWENMENNKKDKEHKEDEIKKLIKIGWLSALGVLGVWSLTFLLLFIPGSDRQGQFGDMFGAVNALFSGLAFAGLIITLILQRKELALQRDELKDNRTEMERHTTQFKEQNNNLEIQRFENLFYNMLNLQQKIVDGLRYDYYDVKTVTVPLDGGGAVKDWHYEKREVVGRDVFRYLFQEVQFTTEVDSDDKKISGYIQYLHCQGMENYDGTLVPSYFDHYFRHLYKIVQFVDSQDFEFNIKCRYLSFLRGTLSRYELVWLYYNSLYPDFYRFKELIERYSLLKALRSDLLATTRETTNYYSELGIKGDDLRAEGIGFDDFAFFLTDNPEDKSKYHISAFWNSKDRQNGIDYLNKRNDFISGKTDQVIEVVK